MARKFVKNVSDVEQVCARFGGLVTTVNTRDSISLAVQDEARYGHVYLTLDAAELMALKVLAQVKAARKTINRKV